MYVCARAALVHGTINWQSAAPRRTLLYKYSPGYSCWMPDAQLAPLRALASAELQRQILRPPSVGALAVRALHFPLSHSFPHTNLKSPCAEQAEEAGGPLRAALRLPEPGRWGTADMETQMRREALRVASGRPAANL